MTSGVRHADHGGMRNLLKTWLFPVVLMALSATALSQVRAPGGGAPDGAAPGLGGWTAVWHTVDDIPTATVWDGKSPEMLIRLFPSQVQQESGPAQVLRARWTDQQGIEHEVETEVPATSNPELYIRRHEKLVEAMKAIYPEGVEGSAGATREEATPDFEVPVIEFRRSRWPLWPPRTKTSVMLDQIRANPALIRQGAK